MLLGDVFRSRRWCTTQFACGLLHSSLVSSFPLLYRLLTRNLLVTYPSAKFFLLKPVSVILYIKIDLQSAYVVTFDTRRPCSASLCFSASSRATYEEISELLRASAAVYSTLACVIASSQFLTSSAFSAFRNSLCLWGNFSGFLPCFLFCDTFVLLL